MLHRVCHQIHEDLLKPVFVTNDSVFNKFTEIACNLDALIDRLELDKLNDFVEDISHDKVIVFLLDVSFAEQGQIHHVIHFDLDKTRRSLYLPQNVQLFLLRYVRSVRYQVYENCDARKRRHEVMTDSGLQHLHHLAVVCLSLKVLTIGDISQAKHGAFLAVIQDLVPPDGHIQERIVRRTN